MAASLVKNIFSIVIFSVLIISCSNSNQQADNEMGEQSNVETVEMAPDFEVTTIDGETISLQSSLENELPVVVYFTASWCPVCARNWPVLSEVYPEFEDRLTFVAISIDPTDTESVMSELAADKEFTFPSTEGHPEIMMAFGVESQATTVGVNRDGSIAFTKNKQALTAEEYRELFTTLVD